jgi:hypothetical protein
MSFSFLAILYVGACLLLMAGRIGMPGLCSFSCAFIVGGVGFFLSGIKI